MAIIIKDDKRSPNGMVCAACKELMIAPTGRSMLAKHQVCVISAVAKIAATASRGSSTCGVELRAEQAAWNDKRWTLNFVMFIFRYRT